MKTTSRTALFGPYVLDLRSGELRKLGIRLKMGEQAFQILRMLLEAPGEMVTREELRAKLWADDTFVDFDHGLNSAVQRLRDSLSDSAGKPRWIETVPRRGYRFVGQVEWSDEPISSDPLAKPGDESRDEGSAGEGQPVDKAQLDPPSESSSPRPTTSTGFGRRAAILAIVAGLLSLAAVPLARRIQDARSARRALLIKSLAVLPLENLSGDPAQDYFADGMTDEVTTMLAKNTSLRVVSRTSAMQYKGVKRPLGDIARELGVDGILEGSINRTPDHVHMTVQLIYAPTDSHVWAESYDRASSQASSLPAELSQTIAARLRIPASNIPSQRHINPEAHDAYLRGRYLWFAGDDVRSQKYFEKAVQIQPDYAAAWSGISDAYAIRGMGRCPAAEVAAKAEIAARKAVELDDTLAEAHHSMAAWYLFYAWDFPHAEAESKRAIELNPNLAETHHLRSYILMSMNRRDEALREQQRATELDPFQRPWTLGRTYMQLRQFDAAVNELKLRAQALPNERAIHYELSDIYWLKGLWKQSEQEFEKGLRLSGRDAAAEAIHRAFERGGQRAVAQWEIEELKAKARKGYVPPLALATQYACLGNKNETLNYIEEAYRTRAPWLVMVQAEPVFDLVHSEPRYQAILRKIGLPEHDMPGLSFFRP